MVEKLKHYYQIASEAMILLAIAVFGILQVVCAMFLIWYILKLLVMLLSYDGQ